MSKKRVSADITTYIRSWRKAHVVPIDISGKKTRKSSV